jgi:hypothetical protein
VGGIGSEMGMGGRRGVAGGGDGKKEKEMVGPTFGGGKWRASRNGGWEGEFGGV